MKPDIGKYWQRSSFLPLLKLRRTFDMKSKILAAIVGLAAMTATSGALAAPITYFGENLTPGATVTGDPVTARTTFLAALAGGVGTEDFERFSNGAASPLTLSFPGSTGSIGATLTGTGTDIQSSGGFGRFATSGSNFVETPGGGDFDINFTAPIAAFGFFGTDLGDVGNDLQITLTDSNSVETMFTLDLSGTPNGGLIFWGFTDTAAQYTQISFDNVPGSGDVFGFDDMTIGDAGQVVGASAPTMLALFGLGILGLGFARRKNAA